MKQLILLTTLIIGIGLSNAESQKIAVDSSWKKIYRESYPKTNELVHTKLEVKFDFSKSWMYGNATITLQPHFYSTDSLTLDAKGMEIKEVAIVKGAVKSQLKYQYDGLQLFIKLDKMYKGAEKYTIFIDYISKPDELKVEGSAAITNAKGLYFINPLGEDKEKPIQIWTQGETEANSVWMPTIDKSNQKSTEEIYLTVPSKYVTLSNGKLISQKKNIDGTRTDYWKMDLPHAPYLFFMGVGDFTIIKDSYKGKEVSYYVEKKEARYAKEVFGNTPKMIQFFSNKLGVEYPWAKYSQIVGRDYVSGAMENTTATLHQESAYQNSRQLKDGNIWEETIAHELFHQWFGDLVTAESWSNLTLNESFANYSEYLWDEFKYGKDSADEHNQDNLIGYLQSGSENKDLVRFKYADKEDMFDGVSYNKGGRILHMLRNYVGEEAFFKSLNNYLTTNKFKAGEASHLRLAFEEVTGKDMNWFWNQWYYGSGHPKVEINYNYNQAASKVSVYIKQTQVGEKVFQLPLSIDVYSGKNKKRYLVWMKNKSDSFTFSSNTKPNLVNVDADKILLWEKLDNKSSDEFIFQYLNTPNYLDRKEALDYFSKKNMQELKLGLMDRYAGLRKLSIDNLAKSKFALDKKIIDDIEVIAEKESNKKTKAAALLFLANTKDPQFLSLYNKFIEDSSYSVAGAALKGLSLLAPSKAYEIAKKYSSDAKDLLGEVVSDILIEYGTENDFEFISKLYNDAPPSQEKLQMTDGFCNYLAKISDTKKIKKGIDYIIAFRNFIPEQYRTFLDTNFKAGLEKVSKSKPIEVADYIEKVFK
ncbi:MAG: M1 family peptidase [Chitinophagia bacterium]|nr:M1 family peptidase [Chitinophagia bacterium]